MSYDLTIKLEEKIIEKNFKFIIADEAHYMKSPDAKRTKCLMPIIKKNDKHYEESSLWNCARPCYGSCYRLWQPEEERRC